MRIAAYCRVSTDREEQMDSLRHQMEFFTDYAQKHGHELTGLYADAGISGTSLKKREEFARLMEDAKRGLFDLVVVKDISRFARNTVDALQSIRALKAMGIHTHFLTANMDTMGDSEFILTLFSAMAQEESSNLSKRVKWGKRINAEKGRVPGQIFGYQRLDNFTLAIHPGEADTVRRIFSLYTEHGHGCRTIARMLNREGRPTKLGNFWDQRGVRRVLTNPIYCGILVNHKYEVTDFLTGKQISLPPSEQFFHRRPQWAILSPEEFQRAQDTLAARKSSRQPHRQGRYSSRHTFSTLIRCACCGRAFTRKQYTYARTRIYWRCMTNEQYPQEHCENRVTLDEDLLLARMGEYLGGMVEDREAFLAQAMRACLPAPAQSQEEELQRRILAKTERYQELYAEGLLDLDTLRKKLDALRRETDCGKPSPEREEGLQKEDILRFLSLEGWTNHQMRKIVETILVDARGQVQVVLKKWERA